VRDVLAQARITQVEEGNAVVGWPRREGVLQVWSHQAMTARCAECGTEIDTSEKRGSRKYCLECAHDINVENTKRRYHKSNNGWHVEKDKQQEGHYWKVVWAPPEHEDLIGIHLTACDFKYGDYYYLKGALLERANKLYTFDGRRCYERS
jgi:hypothetical protein